MSTKCISLVVPFHNESGAIESFHAAVVAVIDALPELQFEVVCVDDGSSDSTLAELCTLVAKDPRFRVIELSRNFGKEAALTAGIEAARGAALIPMDADLQDPPELLPVMLTEWHKGAEVVLARRSDRSSDSFLKRVTASMFYRFHNRLSSVPLLPNVGDFRLLDRIVVDALKSLPERQRFMKGLFAWVGFKTVVVDYVRQPRAAGQTKFSGWRLWNFAIEGITSFSTVPLKVWSYAGGIGAALTTIYAIFVIMRTLIFGADLPGYASLLVAVLFFGSLQLIGIGVLGEYIGRIYMETKQRPTYIVRRVHDATDPPPP